MPFLIVIDESSAPDDNLIGFRESEKSFDECEDICDRSSPDMIREITDIFDTRVSREERSFSVIGENRECGIRVAIMKIFILLQEYEFISEIVGTGGGEYGEMHRTLSYC